MSVHMYIFVCHTFIYWRALHEHTNTTSTPKPQLNKASTVCHCLHSSFVVRQNSWADVVALVITLGLTGSRWLSSYKPRAKAEGKHRHQNNKKLSHRNVVTQREAERVRGNHSHHNAKLLNRPTEKERESEWKLQKRENKAAQNCQRNNRQHLLLSCSVTAISDHFAGAILHGRCSS